MSAVSLSPPGGVGDRRLVGCQLGSFVGNETVVIDQLCGLKLASRSSNE